jgi:hypothetical protein
VKRALFGLTTTIRHNSFAAVAYGITKRKASQYKGCPLNAIARPDENNFPCFVAGPGAVRMGRAAYGIDLGDLRAGGDGK